MLIYLARKSNHVWAFGMMCGSEVLVATQQTIVPKNMVSKYFLPRSLCSSRDAEAHHNLVNMDLVHYMLLDEGMITKYLVGESFVKLCSKRMK
jgi:hypothetical protein